MKIWFVEFPTYQYNEDVKTLAKKAGLKIVDARFKRDYKAEDVATEVPKISKKTAKALKEELGK